jgi:cytochrome c oxidase subunit 3
MSIIESQTIPRERASTPTQAVASDPHEHDPHLAHHFDAPAQQFEAAKLGMWLFLGTEVLLFGGLFCLYAIFRRLHPEIFSYGSAFLDTRWGAINTTILILSSMTMAIGVTAAQRGHKRLLLTMLVATFLGAAGFMGIKYIEYHHKIHEGLVWGIGFYDRPEWTYAKAHDDSGEGIAVDEAAAAPPDAEHGRTLWMATCRACHGVAGEGVTGQGKDIRDSTFIAERTDQDLLDFLKIGRAEKDPLNTTGVQMPPRGGNPLFRDADLLDIVAYVRSITGMEGAAAVAPEEEAFYIPRWVVPEPPEADAGMDHVVLSTLEGHPPLPPEGVPDYPHHSVDPERPPNAHMFFSIYFLMTGLHGCHVLAGMIVIGWLFTRAALGHFGPQYFTPVDLGGLYWHVVDLIWIFLFPLFYLI